MPAQPTLAQERRIDRFAGPDLSATMPITV
jgi:hypothetical protein